MAFAGYALWGIFPVYFYWLRDVSALEVLAHRVVWSMLLLLVISWIFDHKIRWTDLVKSRTSLLACLFSALFLSVNWLIYIWAVANQMAVEGSLGYFINPLVSVVLAVIFLNERLNRYQLLAILFACAGVIYLVLKAGVVPWIALSLAFSFGTYGLIRKKYAVDAFAGLTLETILIAPLATAWLVYLYANHQLALFSMNSNIDALLLSAGVITTLPLLFFLGSLSQLRLSTVGLIQYVAPTLQFIVAIYILKEPFNTDKLIAFCFIWTGLAVFSMDVVRQRRIKNRLRQQA